ncbi:MAG TPA: hypothetical protein VI776_15615 [Anaerolineales bacterium]|jgi:hypothetical protein|nr:hypothetical protein [Anaerolineales bacterium]
MPKRRTKTSPFGCPGRISLDSASFYASRLYEGVERGTDGNLAEDPLPEHVRNQMLRQVRQETYRVLAPGGRTTRPSSPRSCPTA